MRQRAKRNQWTGRGGKTYGGGPIGSYWSVALRHSKLSMYRFVFRTSNFQDVRARAHSRAHIIKRVTRFKWFRGFETSDCVCRPGGFYRVRATYTGDSITWRKYSSGAHMLGAFNMLLLFAFRFCYASSRAAFCMRRIQTFDVRMNGYFRATPSRCGLTFMRITFIKAAINSAGVCV